MSEHELSKSVQLARDQLSALRASLERDDAGPGAAAVLGALRDVQDMLDKLRARYRLLREILDRTNDMLFAKDREGCYLMINSQGAEMFGKPVAEILGTDDRALLASADAERIMAVDRQVMTTGEALTREETCDLRGVRTTLLTATTSWLDEEQEVRGVIGIAQDVTKRWNSERDAAAQQLRMRSMAAEIVISEERLRRALAAELHNGLGQEIALTRMRLSLVRSIAGTELRGALTGIEQLVEQANRSLSSITFQISPPSLHDLGLVAALQWLGEAIGAQFGIAVTIEDADSPPIAEERVRVILYRAVRELLVNAGTHANVQGVTVTLERHADLVRITVEDSGSGFDAKDLDRSGYGLLGIREQIKYVGGDMQITSALGHGTTVVLTAQASVKAADPAA